MVGASAALAVRNARALDVAARTQATAASLSQLLEDVTDAETGQRGYLLTGKESYLQPYERGSLRAPSTLATLAQHLRDDPDAASLASRLTGLVDVKLVELSQTVAAMKAGRRDDAMSQVQSDRGQRDMEAIRALAGQLADRQQRLLAEQLRSVELGGEWIVLIDALGLTMLAALGGATILRMRRAMVALRDAQHGLAEANAELEGLNERLEHKVAQRTSDLTEANEEIQRFAYIVSHDLRAPLVNIMGFTGELETATQTLSRYVARLTADDPSAAPPEVIQAAKEDLPEAIRFIKTSSGKMDRLIAAILKLSREGRRVMTAERIAMRPFLQGIADSLQHQCEESGSEIVIDTAPDLRADRVMLEQIFSNLMENAVKYAVPGRPGRITVSGKAQGDMASFEVRDNGRGIAARDHERIFELFRRAGDQRVPGEGIGLAHVRALVRRLGGTIDCNSQEGVGSTFRLNLPVNAQPAGEAG